MTIGGPSESARNLISGNDGPGVEIAFDAEGANLQGNVIGADATETRRFQTPTASGARSGAQNRIGAGSTSEET